MLPYDSGLSVGLQLCLDSLVILQSQECWQQLVWKIPDIMHGMRVRFLFAADIAPGQEEEGGAVEFPPTPKGRLCLRLVIQVLVKLQQSKSRL